MYRNLRAEMARREIKVKDLAEDPVINCTASTMSLKLKGQYPLTLSEAVRIKELLNNVDVVELPLDELFATDEGTDDS